MSKNAEALVEAIIEDLSGEFLTVYFSDTEAIKKIEARIAAFESECIQQTREIILSAARSANVEGQ